MQVHDRLSNLVTLKEILAPAQAHGYAVGAFSPRLTPLILPVLETGQRLHAPLIVQISQTELNRAGISPAAFAREFYAQMRAKQITVPVVLHLDHSKELEIIADAISVGFTSVMIDASDKPLEENIALTRRVVDYAHARGVSVEGEIGRIGATDKLETGSDVEGLTDPEEARRMAEETGVDALAVSVGTAHGLYTRQPPHIDFERIAAIHARTPVPLVLHGGSDVPAELIRKAVQLPGGGVSKINIATDLEIAMLQALSRD
ncbi:MAG: class II fructose-bisphosphate aldolase, partial [Rudaea sp.]